MKRLAAALAIGMATQAGAGGLDLTGQPTTFLFQRGTVAELGFGRIQPSITGNDTAAFGSGASGNIASDITLPFLSFKTDLTERLSFGISYETPFGADVAYAPTSLAFGGTRASAETASVTALLRYRLSDRVSVHGGLRWQRASAEFLLTGAVYGPIAGYGATMSGDDALGYVAGVTYEIPEYFIRATLTYSSAISHSFPTVESQGPVILSTAPTEAETPQSLNFEFTAGVAPKTFVFGGARWVDWSELRFDPAFLVAFAGEGLVDFNDTITYSLGVGRQLNDRWTLLASLLYEPGTDPLTTPLAPTDGFWGVSLGAVYAMDNTEIHANVTATFLGDATPEVGTPDMVVGSFTDNSSLGFGLKLVHRF